MIVLFNEFCLKFIAFLLCFISFNAKKVLPSADYSPLLLRCKEKLYHHAAICCQTW